MQVVKTEKPKPSVLQSAIAMSLGTFLSRIFGLLRDMAIAAFFSITVKDAYVVAFRLPNLFRRLFGEGSLAASFIPLYVEFLNKQKEVHGVILTPEQAQARAQELANAVYTLLIVFTGLLTALCIIFMEPIIHFLVSGESYQSVQNKVELTIKMAQIMFGFVFLVTLYAFLMSILNVYKKYFWPAVAPAAFNFVMIAFCFLPEFQFHGDVLAWGVLAGGVVQLLFVIVPLMRMQLMPRLALNLSVHGVEQFFKTLVPSVLGMSVLQIMTLFNTFFASQLPEGSHTYIYFADRLLEFPLSLLSVSLGVALLPTLSQLWAQGDVKEMKSLGRKHVQLLLFLSLPSTVGLYLLAEPLVALVYQRGAFNLADTQATAEVLKVYSFLLVFSGVHRVTVPHFYAIKNTWLPAVTSIMSLIAHVLIAPIALAQYGLLGLVASTTLAALLNLLFLLIAYRFYFGAWGAIEVIKSIFYLLPSLILMGLFVFYAQSTILNLTKSNTIAVLVSIFGAMIIFFAVNMVLKNNECAEFIALVKKKRQRYSR